MVLRDNHGGQLFGWRHHRHDVVAVMGRQVAIIGAGIFIFASIVGGTAVYFVNADRDRRELQDARDHIETRERIDEAIDADPDCSWRERLLGQCE